MSEPELVGLSQTEPDQTTVPLGDATPARSRHGGRRSAVTVLPEHVVAGTADGSIRAFDGETLDEHWRVGGEGSVVALTPFEGGVAVGTRGSAGDVRLVGTDGSLQWSYRTARDVGEAAKETRFYLPFVVSLATDGDRLYAAARRYERDGDRRLFESVVYAFTPDGRRDWTYRTDASPISLAAGEGRVAVAYNRCPGDHDRGLVVLDGDTGETDWTWDPGTEGQRRVGDVSLVDGRVAVASHGDYRGYLLAEGETCWQVDLARPRAIDDDTVYAYSNHVHATGGGVVFVTGNTYPEEGRETDARHPRANTAIGFDSGGTLAWEHRVGGFASGIGVAGDRVAVPSAQAFRERDPSTHACRLFDVRSGPAGTLDTDGIVTAAALDDGTLAAIEEPVVYHDEGTVRGEYLLHAVG